MKIFSSTLALAATIPGSLAWATPATLGDDLQTLRAADSMAVPAPAVQVPAPAAPHEPAVVAETNPVPPPALPEALSAATVAQEGTAVPPATLPAGTGPLATVPADATATVTLPGAAAAPAAATEKPLPPALFTNEPMNPWQAATLVTLSLAGLGIFGWTLVRFRRRTTHSSLRSEKPMQVISTLPLSPKRQLIMVRIRDQEIVLSSTEQGIVLLTEVSAQRALPRPMAEARPMVEARPLPPLPRPAEVAQEARESLARVAAPQSDSNPPAPEPKPKPAAKKADFLAKALNGIKEKKSEPVAPTLPQTRGNFNKYVANVFEQEAKRDLKEKADDANEDTVESVTRMIRERLKNIQPQSEGGA